MGGNVVCDKVVGDKVVSERFACETMFFNVLSLCITLLMFIQKKVVLGGASEPTGKCSSTNEDDKSQFDCFILLGLDESELNHVQSHCTSDPSWTSWMSY